MVEIRRDIGIDRANLEGMLVSRTMTETLLMGVLRGVAAGSLPRLDLARELREGADLLLRDAGARASITRWAERQGIAGEGIDAGYKHFERHARQLIDQFRGSERQQPSNG